MSYSYGLRGLILQQLGQSPYWIRDCLKSYELDPDAAVGLSNIVGVQDEKVREQIIEEIERERSPSNGYYKLEADLLYTWNAYDRAAKTYKDMIGLGLAKPETYYYLSDCQERLGNPIDAYSTASEGLDKFPNESSLMLMKAHIGILTGHGADVLAILESLISQSPEDFSLYLEKGKALMSLGRYSEAVEPFSMAVILKPTALNKMYYGDALRLSDDKMKADSEYNDILKMSETDIANEEQIPQSMYAMVYSGLGDIDKAIAAVKDLSGKLPDVEISSMPLLYARAGMKSKAIDALKKYSNEAEWSALSDLYSYNFYNLHSEPEFAKLMASNGVNTRYNDTTHLLEYVPEDLYHSAGGTPLGEVMNLLANNPANWVEEVNKLCPIDMGAAGQIVSVAFDNQVKIVSINYVSDPEMINFKLINSSPSYKKKNEDIIMLGH